MQDQCPVNQRVSGSSPEGGAENQAVINYFIAAFFFGTYQVHTVLLWIIFLNFFTNDLLILFKDYKKELFIIDVFM
jgi:hypothetical protein